VADFSLKAHDLLPSITATLVDADQAPVNVSSSTVSFIMAQATNRIVAVNADAVIVDGPNGIVRYDWDPADTAAVGEFVAEWQVTFPGGKKQTFPSAGYNTVSIVADLDNA
jgi:hypothetical protein